MAFKYGQGGRRKGSKNKNTDLFSLCEKEQINVFKEMLLEIKAMDIGESGRFNKLSQCAQYLYAKPKEVEVTTEQVRAHLESVVDDSERSA